MNYMTKTITTLHVVKQPFLGPCTSVSTNTNLITSYYYIHCAAVQYMYLNFVVFVRAAAALDYEYLAQWAALVNRYLLQY